MWVRLAFIAAALGLLAACTDTSTGSEAVDDASDGVITQAPTDGFEVVEGPLDPADEVTEGDDWELLGSGERTDDVAGLSLVTDAAELEGIWATNGLDGGPPSVDHDEQAVVFVTVPTSCAFVLRDVVVDPDVDDGTVTRITELDLQAQVDGTCDDTDLTGRDLAFAVDRELVDDRRVEIVRGGVPVGAITQP